MRSNIIIKIRLVAFHSWDFFSFSFCYLKPPPFGCGSSILCRALPHALLRRLLPPNPNKIPILAVT